VGHKSVKVQLQRRIENALCHKVREIQVTTRVSITQKVWR